MAATPTILSLFLLIVSALPLSLSQLSASSQNIQTFYPSSRPPVVAVPPPPPPADDPPAIPPPVSPQTPPAQPPPAGSSTRKAVGKAIGATVASTLVVSGLLFFIFLTYSRRKRKLEDDKDGGRPVVAAAAVATGGGGGGGNNPVERKDKNFDRYGSNVKGLIVDENGLDVLYWKNMLDGENSSFKKQYYRSLKDEEREEEKRVVSERDSIGKKKKAAGETPLLRGQSSSSQSPVWVDKDPQIMEKIPSLSNGISIKIEKQLSSSVKHVPPTLPPPPGAQPRPPPPPPQQPLRAAEAVAVPKEKMAAPSPPVPPIKGPSPPPPPPPSVGSSMRPPPQPRNRSSSAGEGSTSSENGQVKLKPLHWDKVNANVEHSMVWDKIDKGSFKFDGDLMEALFGYVATNRKSPRGDGKSTSALGEKSGPPAKIFILDTRKSQNTAIVLKSLGISRKDIIDALIEGQGLNADAIEKLTKIAPTDEESAQIIAFNGDPSRLADAESFLYHLLKAVPSAFKRFDALLFRSNYELEVSSVKDSLQSLESACKELRTRGLFLKLLEAVLKAGNRLNAGTARGNAQAFNLTALRKLSDVKSSDGKTTLLQFVVQEVVRAEGKRCVLNKNRSLSKTSSQSSNGMSQIAENSSLVSKDDREREYMMLGLPVIGGLSAEFSNVKKAAVLDYDVLVKSTSALATQVVETRSVVAQCGRDGGFEREMNGFLDTAELEMKVVEEEQTRVMEIVKKTTDYYQAGSSKDKNPLQLFVIVRDFLGMVDQVCIEVARDVQKRKPASPVAGSSSPSPGSPRVFRFPKLPPNFMSDASKSSSSDSDSDSEVR